MILPHIPIHALESIPFFPKHVWVVCMQAKQLGQSKMQWKDAIHPVCNALVSIELRFSFESKFAGSQRKGPVLHGFKDSSLPLGHPLDILPCTDIVFVSDASRTPIVPIQLLRPMGPEIGKWVDHDTLQTGTRLCQLHTVGNVQVLRHGELEDGVGERFHLVVLHVGKKGTPVKVCACRKSVESLENRCLHEADAMTR